MDRKALDQKLNLRVELVPKGRPNRSGKQISATHITIHNTSNPGKGANANAHSKFVREKGFYPLASGKVNQVSWHFTVDDSQVIKHLPVNERGIHAGGGNAVSIGIEICMHQGIDQEAADVRAANLVAALMFDLKIPKDKVVTHQSWTQKACPTLLIKGDRFAAFQRMADTTFKSISDQQELPALAALVSPDESVAIEKKRRSILDGLEGPADPIEDDPDDAHELVSNGVNEFVE
jgi:N-acetylmuramoyl-L-alanine amidase CwlA